MQQGVCAFSVLGSPYSQQNFSLHKYLCKIKYGRNAKGQKILRVKILYISPLNSFFLCTLLKEFFW